MQAFHIIKLIFLELAPIFKNKIVKKKKLPKILKYVHLSLKIPQFFFIFMPITQKLCEPEGSYLIQFEGHDVLYNNIP